MEIGSSSIQSGIQGFNRAQSKITQAASEIASVGTGSEDSAAALTSPLVDLIEGEQAAKANARTIETANDVLGSIIDIRA